MTDGRYVRAMELAEFIMPPPRIKGMVIWADAGLKAAQLLVGLFRRLVAERYHVTESEHGFLADDPSYRAVFDGYANVHQIANDSGCHPGALLRPDNLVTTISLLRSADVVTPHVATGGLLRRFDGSTPPLFRDRYIWPAVQLTQRVPRDQAGETLEFYRQVVERLLARLGLATITVRTSTLAEYGRETNLVMSALPDGRPTVLATLYLLSDRLRRALGEDLEVVDVGFTGKLIATLVMVHRDRRGVVLPSDLAPVHLAVTMAQTTEAERVNRWRGLLTADGIRTVMGPPSRTRAHRDRAERRWLVRGVPLVLGLDRHQDGHVVLATRAPLTRVGLSSLPSADEVRRYLSAHDERLLAAGNALLERSLRAGDYLQNLCPACSSTRPVFGSIVPERRTTCTWCPQEGAPMFVAPEGRFY